MAAVVATWPERYGCDGIDLDIADGAGDAPGAGPNMIHFVAKLRELSPKMIISQPTYGYPAVSLLLQLHKWHKKIDFCDFKDKLSSGLSLVICM